MPKISVDARRARRQELIDAGWRCVARSGYHKVTVDDVCAEAGLSKGAFYTHFEQKEDLLLALLDADAATLEAIITELSETGSSGIDRIRRYLRAVLKRSEDEATVQMRADLWAEVNSNPVVLKLFVEGVRRRRALLAEWVRAAIEDGELTPNIPANAFASILLSLADGLMLHYSIDPTGFRWPNVRTAVDALLDGIRA